MSVENGGPERQTVSDGGRRDGKNTENPSRLSILLPWFLLSPSPTPHLTPTRLTSSRREPAKPGETGGGGKVGVVRSEA